jgi:hypothetical protein
MMIFDVTPRARNGEVCDDEVRLQVDGGFNQTRAVENRAHHLTMVGEQSVQPFGHHHVVIGKEGSGRCCGHHNCRNHPSSTPGPCPPEDTLVTVVRLHGFGKRFLQPGLATS